jgi:threonine dehydratase
MKIVVEPTGCLGFAAVRALGTRLAGQRVGLIVSGGNIDGERMSSLLKDS